MEKIKFLKDCTLLNVSVGLVLGVGGSLEDHLPKDENGETKHYEGGDLIGISRPLCLQIKANEIIQCKGHSYVEEKSVLRFKAFHKMTDYSFCNDLIDETDYCVENIGPKDFEILD